jgi:hypothetical protein
MRRFRVIDGSNDDSLAVPKHDPDRISPSSAAGETATPADGPARQDTGDDPAATADGLITASTGYDAALRTTANIRQRSLLDFLR